MRAWFSLSDDIYRNVYNGEKALHVNEKNSLDYGLLIKEVQDFPSPEYDVTYTEVLGRNGAYVIPNNRFKMVEMVLHCIIVRKPNLTIEQQMTMVKRFLRGNLNFYKIIRFSFDEDHIYHGMISQGFVINHVDNDVAYIDIPFTLQPTKELISGYTVHTLTGSNDVMVTPPSVMVGAKPYIIAENWNSSACLVNFYGLGDSYNSQLRAPNAPSRFELDFKLKTAMNGYENISYRFTPDVFNFKLVDEKQRLHVSSGVSIKIIPRWEVLI